MENNKNAQSGKTLRKAGLGIVALMLAAVSLSACIVAEGPGYRGGWHRHQWNNDWNGGPGWQGDGGGSWHHYH